MESNMLTGEYKTTLDEKGRIMFPSKLRTGIELSKLVMTRGIDGCLWIFPPAQWQDFYNTIRESTSLFEQKSRAVLRHLVAPAQEVDIEKSGRVSIPLSLRESCGLDKECYIVCMNKFFELWDAKKYETYLKESEADFMEATKDWHGIGF